MRRSRKSGKGEQSHGVPFPKACWPGLTKTLLSASGLVFVAKSLETGAKVAIKQMDLAQQPRKELVVNEIVVMKESHHPNVVNFMEAFLIQNTELWVVMELMEGGALTDVIENNKLEEDQIAGICFEVGPSATSTAKRREMS